LSHNFLDALGNEIIFYMFFPLLAYYWMSILEITTHLMHKKGNISTISYSCWSAPAPKGKLIGFTFALKLYENSIIFTYIFCADLSLLH